MLRDHTIPKPPSLDGYGLHRLVQGLTGGDSPLFVDMGDRVVVRTAKPITDAGKPPRTAEAGEIVGFELRACVARKVRGRHRLRRSPSTVREGRRPVAVGSAAVRRRTAVL